MIQAPEYRWSFLGQIMVALNEQFHHNAEVTGDGLRVTAGRNICGRFQ